MKSIVARRITSPKASYCLALYPYFLHLWIQKRFGTIRGSYELVFFSAIQLYLHNAGSRIFGLRTVCRKKIKNLTQFDLT